MQPQQVYPSISPPTTEQPTLPSAALTTDQRIAQENAQVFVFEHGPPELPNQHRLLYFIGRHKSTIAIALVAVVLLSSGGAFAFTKLQTLTKAPKTQASTVATKQVTSSTGGVADAADSNDETSDTTDDTSAADSDNSTDDSGDTTNDTGTDTNNNSNTNTNNDGNTDGEGDPATPETPDPAEVVVTPTPTPVPPTPSPVTAHKFTVASWNSNVDNKLALGDQIKSIMSKTQVLGVQEVHHTDQRVSIISKVTCSSCAYAGYLASYSSGTASQSSYPIIWNKSYFNQIGSGQFRQMCDAAKTSKYSYAARYATYVRLQSKVNGKQFYVINTHFMEGVESGGKPLTDTLLLTRYKTHMTNLIALINDLKKADVPIYVVGRFNVNYRYDHTVKTSFFPYASLGAIGVRSGWDVLNLSGISSSAQTDGTGSRIIDYVSTTQRSDVSANSVAISTSTYGAGNYVAFYTSTIK